MYSYISTEGGSCRQGKKGEQIAHTQTDKHIAAQRTWNNKGLISTRSEVYLCLPPLRWKTAD